MRSLLKKIRSSTKPTEIDDCSISLVSLSSTLSTDGAAYSSKKPTLLPSLKPSKSSLSNKKQLQSVRFDLSKNKSSKVAANTRSSAACWYQAADYEVFSANSFKLGDKLASDNKPESSKYRRVLTDAYRSCCATNNAIPAYLQDHMDVTSRSFLCQADQKDMKTCMNISYSRLGLDTMILPSLNEDSYKRRSAVRRKLLEYQRKHHDMTYETKSELLRKKLQPLTRPSCLWAAEKARALSI